MEKFRSAVVLAGEERVNNRIDVPRDKVTHIIAQGASIKLNSKTIPTNTGFKTINPHYGQKCPLIHIKKLPPSL